MDLQSRISSIWKKSKQFIDISTMKNINYLEEMKTIYWHCLLFPSNLSWSWKHTGFFFPTTTYANVYYPASLGTNFKKSILSLAKTLTCHLKQSHKKLIQPNKMYFFSLLLQCYLFCIVCLTSNFEVCVNAQPRDAVSIKAFKIIVILGDGLK